MVKRQLFVIKSLSVYNYAGITGSGLHSVHKIEDLICKVTAIVVGGGAQELFI